MFVRSYKFMPLYAPEMEGGADVDAGSDAAGVTDAGADGTAGGADAGAAEPAGKASVRESLTRAIDEVRAATDGFEDDRKKKRGAKRGQAAAAGAEAGAEGAATAAGEAGAAAAEDGAAEGQPQEQQPGEVIAAPESLPKEAKVDWAKTPASVQKAFVKREQDMARGVQELKNRYSEIDTVLQPHAESFRRHNLTPGQAVEKLFQWQQAIANDAVRQRNGELPVAIIGLAKSYGIDLVSALGMTLPAAADASSAQPEGEVPPKVQEYIGRLEARLGQLEQGIGQGFEQIQSTFQSQSFEKTNQALNYWAQGKTHFEAVRQTMARLIASGQVPPLEDGQADLDTAYETAVWMHPELRTALLAEQRQQEEQERKRKADAERKAQEEQAAKARRAAGSLTPQAPGSVQPGGSGKGPKKGLSVRESLKAAIQEVGGA